MRSRSAVALLLFAVASPTRAEPAESATAFRLEAGSVARDEIVALGRDVVLAGEALADVAVLDGSADVAGHVVGDLTVLGGEARLAPTARIDGDVFVLGGRIQVSPGARVGGRSVAYPTFSRAWLTLLEGPSLGLAASSPIVLATKLALAAAWLALTLLLYAMNARSLVATAGEVLAEPLRCLATGLVGLAAMVLTALFFSSFLPALVSLPLLALVLIAALLLKLWGLVAVFDALGGVLARRFLSSRPLALHAAVGGLLLLSALKLLPWVGLPVWTIASLVGIGAALRSKFGRREPWFDPRAAAVSSAG